MTIAAKESYHDAQLVDIIITCGDCNARFNDFVSVDQMMNLEDEYIGEDE